MSGRVESHVRSHYEFPGAVIQLVDYTWNGACEIPIEEPELTLRWRVRPDRLNLTMEMESASPTPVGRLMLHGAGSPFLALSPVSETATTVLCRFDRRWLQAELAQDWNKLAKILDSSSDFRNLGVSHLMRKIAYEFSNPDSTTPLSVRALGASVGIELVRYARQLLHSTPPARALSSRQADEIEIMIKTSPTVLNATDIARRFCLGEAHLRRLFKSRTGRSVHDVIEEDRLDRARRLLRETDLKLKVIAHEVGYKYPSAFTYAFGRSTGETPIAFRRRFRD
jgi:AraC family transcriptional regulator